MVIEISCVLILHGNVEVQIFISHIVELFSKFLKILSIVLFEYLNSLVCERIMELSPKKDIFSISCVLYKLGFEITI